MKRTIIVLLAALLGAPSLKAQTAASPEYRFGGLTFNRDLMMAWDFAELSRPQNFGTARATGMGGAFASLGADMTSMSLNPAGLGMYRRSEFSLTPLVALSRAETPGTADWAGNGKNRFALADVGVALNVYQNASNALTSLTVGFGVNRISDFNTRFSYSTESLYDAQAGTSVPSIADLFVAQLRQSNVYPERKSGSDPNGLLEYRNPYFWPAVEAYKSAMIHVNPTTGAWERDAIGADASVLRSVDMQQTGSINEFDLSVGANVNNIVYIGATLGIQSVYRRSDVVYGEDYGYFANADGLARDESGAIRPAQLEYADLWQRTVVEGSGVNFKLGVIVRPVGGLRLGMAIHTPTFYSLERSYRSGMDYLLLSNEGGESVAGRFESPVQYDEGGDSWEFVSPTRLMFGASYTFGQVAILSVDYERDWYNGMRVKNVPQGADFSEADYKADFKANFCASNAVRAGIEIRPLPILALRAGGGYTSSLLRDQTLAYEVPQTTESYYFTAGAGVNISRSVTLDVAYQHLTEKQSSYMLFYACDRATGDFVSSSGLFDTSFKRHFLLMTLGVRF